MGWISKDKNQKLLLSGILFFNLLDVVFTLFMVDAGFAVEANPFMLALIEISYLLFASIKISLVSLCVFLFWRLREHSLSRLAAIFCFLVYFSLILYHLFGIFVSLT